MTYRRAVYLNFSLVFFLVLFVFLNVWSGVSMHDVIQKWRNGLIFFLTQKCWVVILFAFVLLLYYVVSALSEKIPCFAWLFASGIDPQAVVKNHMLCSFF